MVPTLVLLFGLDMKLIGSPSLAISPTMIVGFPATAGMPASACSAGTCASWIWHWLDHWHLHRRSAVTCRSQRRDLSLLAAILVISAVKAWRHK